MRLSLIAVTALLFATTNLSAQRADHSPRRILSIGDYPNVQGLRLNFRDDGLERVDGMNVTIWTPYDPITGTVSGLALGLPITGAEEIHGVSLGVFGVAGGRDLTGITVGGLGAGAGRRVEGLAVGGLGVGSGGSIEGIAIGGVGAGAGGNVRGALIGGIGSGAGGNVKGIAIGGVGVGAGGTITGIALGGIGVGAGARIRGFAASAIGVGSPALEGGFAALAVGAVHAEGIVLAPVMFRIERGGSFRGGSVSAVNYIRGSQTGITIGIVNYARSVNGAQIGVINIIADHKRHPVLPVFNWGQ
jgi:hypothetical protein